VLKISVVVVLRSNLFWAYIALSIPVLWVGAVLIWLLTLPFDPRRRVLHAYTCWWGAHYMHVSPFWTFDVVNREKIEPRGTYVLAANHQSLGDTLLMFAIHKHFKWVSKRSVFRVPFLGWNMHMNRYVPLERGAGDSIRKMMDACEAHLAAGSSIMIFPEGTRSRDGRLRDFKHGAFTLAVKADVPVVPIVIEGSRDALPADGYLFEKHGVVIHVVILDPVHPREVNHDRNALRLLVRDRIAEHLAQMRGVPVADVIGDERPRRQPDQQATG
jgi:1-acyl-sn-glycerol-3-phosphate acyltransferase